MENARQQAGRSGGELLCRKTDTVPLAFGASLFLAFLLYRCLLFATIYFGNPQTETLRREHTPLIAFVQTLGTDLVVVVGLVLAGWGLNFWIRARAPRLAVTKVFVSVQIVASIVVLFFFGLILLAHGQLLRELDSGLTITAITMGSQAFGWKDFSGMFSLGDVAFLAAPLAAFVGVHFRHGWLERWYKPVVAVAGLLLLAIELVPTGKTLSPELSWNPVAYLLKDCFKAPAQMYWGRSSAYLARTNLPGPLQMHSIPLVDEAFVNDAAVKQVRESASGGGPAAAPRLTESPTTHEGAAVNGEGLRTPGSRKQLADEASAVRKSWNVLFFVLESTGADYVFDTSLDNEMPMPFLRRICQEGLWLTNHFTTCNSSPNAGFSLFTGLYPRPSREIFALAADAAVPTLNRYLGGDFDSFLVYPSSLSYSFPRALLANNGFKEVHSKENLPPGGHQDVTELARNEFDSMEFFAERVDRAREPFLGVYWSFIAHHPYSDYGPEFRIAPNTKNKRHLYYNNLRTLDVLLQRVFEHLQEKGKAERTVFVLVGDHGEAFGQHPGVWAHSFGSYSEMYRVPAVFWQPRLVPARMVRRPTSHVDILPTLLDLIGVSWDGTKFQGESVLREPRRKYIFAMDAQADYVTAIDQQMNKVSLSYEHSTALVFNVLKDPGEKFPLNEDRFGAQIEAILKFRNYQNRMISEYNRSLSKPGQGIVMSTEGGSGL